jgi:hypothetical protein
MKRVPANPDRLLLDDIRGLIEQARLHVAQTANSAQTLLYWQVGERIRREVLGKARADYGEQIVSTLSTQLVQAYGQGLRAAQFAPHGAILRGVSRRADGRDAVARIELEPFH